MLKTDLMFGNSLQILLLPVRMMKRLCSGAAQMFGELKSGPILGELVSFGEMEQPAADGPINQVCAAHIQLIYRAEKIHDSLLFYRNACLPHHQFVLFVAESK